MANRLFKVRGTACSLEQYRKSFGSPPPKLELSLAPDGTVLTGHMRLTAVRQLGHLVVQIGDDLYDLSEWKAVTMSPEEVIAIREALGRVLGRRVSQRDLGLALRLAPANAADTVRSWEDGSREVTGPASVALHFMREATDIKTISPTPYFTEGMTTLVRRMFGEF